MVVDYASGCIDGSTEGLSHHEGVQACGGAWRGHVKRGRHLCARGWHVCSARHASMLRHISWLDAALLDGCFAYNAANKLSSCSRWVGDRAGRQVVTGSVVDHQVLTSAMRYNCNFLSRFSSKEHLRWQQTRNLFVYRESTHTILSVTCVVY